MKGLRYTSATKNERGTNTVHSQHKKRTGYPQTAHIDETIGAVKMLIEKDNKVNDSTPPRDLIFSC